jgi:hypothetical protein
MRYIRCGEGRALAHRRLLVETSKISGFEVLYFQIIMLLLCAFVFQKGCESATSAAQRRWP